MINRNNPLVLAGNTDIIENQESKILLAAIGIALLEELQEGWYEASVGFANHADAIDFVESGVLGEGE
jgi:hypothetical protein